jgi:hypothetical protein
MVVDKARTPQKVDVKASPFFNSPMVAINLSATISLEDSKIELTADQLDSESVNQKFINTDL